MPADARRIRQILEAENAAFASLSASFRGYLGYNARLLYDELRATGKEEMIGQEFTTIRELGGRVRDLANNFIALRRHYARIWALAKYETPDTDSARELLAEAIVRTSGGLDYLRPAQDEVKVIRPAWGDRIGFVIEEVLTYLLELEEMITLFRAHLSHMWYRKIKARDTPDPFAMVSVFAYTTKPNAGWRERLRSAIAFLESDPDAFSTLEIARTSTSPAAKRKGGSGGGAFYKTTGFEVAQVDRDELDVYREEEIRYYVAFYKTRGRVVNLYKEYWGSISEVDGRWVIIDQQNDPAFEPLWKETDARGWPGGLEP